MKRTTHSWGTTCLDSSAALKLVSSDHVSKRIRRYLQESVSPFTITQVSFSVALVLLKTARHHRRNTEAARIYDEKCSALMTCVRNGWIRTVGPATLEPNTTSAAESLARQREIDLVEALELMTIRNAHVAGRRPDEPLIVTASGPLTRVARAEGFNVWDCVREPLPPRPPLSGSVSRQSRRPAVPVRSDRTQDPDGNH